MAFDLYTIPVTSIDGSVQSLAEHRGRVMLVVNVASKCGLTPQYEGLQKVHDRYATQGLDVLGFPANDFAGQEPGTDAEIRTFCDTKYNVAFPMFSKIQVTGPEKHPLYAELIAQQPVSQGEGKPEFRQGLIDYGIQPNGEPEVLWNFEKFLISRKGEVVARFSPDTLPDSPVITSAIEAELARAN